MDELRYELYPLGNANINLRHDIDTLNEQIYVSINNGAYGAGFSSDPAVYAAAFAQYFDTLAALAARLPRDDRPFLTGNTFKKANLRLFPTL